MAEKKELAELRLQGKEVWQNWRDQYNIPERQQPEWMELLAQRDRELIEQPEPVQEPEKAPEPPALEPEKAPQTAQELDLTAAFDRAHGDGE
jgi:hypothetical protein